jgi:hypothetical protein
MLKDSKYVDELVMWEDRDSDQGVYICFIGESTSSILEEQFPNEAAALAAYPDSAVSWRDGDREDGRGVIAVGYPKDEED